MHDRDNDLSSLRDVPPRGGVWRERKGNWEVHLHVIVEIGTPKGIYDGV